MHPLILEEEPYDAERCAFGTKISKVIAIGETDDYKAESTAHTIKRHNKAVFGSQIDSTNQLDKPVIIPDTFGRRQHHCNVT